MHPEKECVLLQPVQQEGREEKRDLKSISCRRINLFCGEPGLFAATRLRKLSEKTFLARLQKQKQKVYLCTPNAAAGQAGKEAETQAFLAIH
ncbi:hypothetical protein [Pontibacter fetidus]|uniref:Uncharacterized protein n=1 Tax=Pontibacter fetidus TaxID=2700082 RepID=A0A6B2H180_9BACT|nr:hypothetical protein [Pontibacter fetidus]NDK56865.1 hypothetical protein [Pontibacter fetidus]